MSRTNQRRIILTITGYTCISIIYIRISITDILTIYYWSIKLTTSSDVISLYGDNETLSLLNFVVLNQGYGIPGNPRKIGLLEKKFQRKFPETLRKY